MNDLVTPELSVRPLSSSPPFAHTTTRTPLSSLTFVFRRSGFVAHIQLYQMNYCFSYYRDFFSDLISNPYAITVFYLATKNTYLKPHH